ncbi:MAG: type II toxin-antitoxin system RnlB family antitoxin [Spirochaetaceae bacterium]|nr:type II toxin-antitoxin system RnlB family antitoxin [Spirochaetaceae bacterium]
MSFSIYVSPNKTYNYLVINTDSFALGDKICLLNKELKERNFIGNILLNTRTTSNTKQNQYSEVFFNGNNIVLNTLKHINIQDKDIKKIVTTCLKHANNI